jgi:hypothetical protein
MNNRIINIFPIWLAPNLITLSGLIVSLMFVSPFSHSSAPASFFVSPHLMFKMNLFPLFSFAKMVGITHYLTAIESPNFNVPLPSWLSYLCGAILIAYQTVDNLDGTQVTRTKRSWFSEVVS